MSQNPEFPSHSTDRTSPTMLQRMRERDCEAWDRFVRLYEPLVFHWCARTGMNASDAKDITQGVLARVSEKLHTFDRSRAGASFRGWLRVITRNKIVDFYRAFDRQEHAAGGSTANKRIRDFPADLSTDADENQRELSGLYSRAVELMKENFEERTWQAFWMSVVEERSTADVCQQLKMKPGSVRMARHRVLKLLREQLGEMLE